MKNIAVLTLAAGVLAFAAGCESRPSAYYSGRADMVIGADDYEYYPGYEVYYSPAHRYYYYRDGRSWVRRQTPPRAWAQGSPSVHVHFNDAPERHHAEIVRQYPHNWRPAGSRPIGDDWHDHDRR